MVQHQPLWTAARWFGVLSLALLTSIGLSSCSSGKKTDRDDVKKDADGHKDQGKPDEAAIKAERDKLAPADRNLVDEQDTCAVMPDSKLGGMGQPIKVMLKGQPVFVCCKGCVKKAERNPDQTLARVAELKGRNKAGPK